MKWISPVVVLSLAIASSAAAQTQLPGTSFKPIVPPAQQERKPREPPPPALPGSRSQPAAIAPATRVPMDMPPTDALFDAINRGDLAVAKDAVARGADFQGRNVLGLTPLELSVDLGRNQISFYLLSLRGEGPSGARPAPTETTQAAARPEPKPARNAVRAAAEPAPAAPQTAKLFANDGGAAVSQAGFLGFSPNR